MNELIGKKIHESFGGKRFEEIVEIVCYTKILLLVKVRADDGFEMYEEEWCMGFFNLFSHYKQKRCFIFFRPRF